MFRHSMQEDDVKYGNDKRNGLIVLSMRLLVESGYFQPVAINYRYTSQANGIKPPVKAPFYDAARALQFVRIIGNLSGIQTRHASQLQEGSAGASPVYGCSTTMTLPTPKVMTQSPVNPPVSTVPRSITHKPLPTLSK